MSEWSHESAAKFKRKQVQDYRTHQIIEDEGLTQFMALGELFDAEAASFNMDSQTHTLQCDRALDDQFEVKRQGSKAYLRGLFNRKTNRIMIEGIGGLKYKEEFSIEADLESGSAYFSNSDGGPIEMEKIVHGALSALLGI